MLVYLQRAWLRISDTPDPFPTDREPAVWRLDDDVYIVLAGQKYLAHRPKLEVVRCKLIEAGTLEAARAAIKPRRLPRPSLPALKKLIDRIDRLADPTPEERAFRAGLDYAIRGVSIDCPQRIKETL